MKGEKVTKKELTGRIKKLKPSLLVLNGHGSEDSITGQDGKTLIKSGENENLLHSRLTYAVACCSGKVLGPKTVEKEGTTFIGYDDDFVFTSNKKYLSQPLKDTMAQPFMEASNHVPISLLKGHKAIDASSRSKEMFKRSYRQLLSSESNPDALQSARYL